MQSFRVALSFLTILPVAPRHLPAAEVLARSRLWYPVVGVLLGSLLGGWTALLGDIPVSPLTRAFLVLLAWVVTTGALHMDGLCDLCDGLFGGRDPEERLRILRDPHLGTFGLAGGVLLLLGKLVLLGDVLASRPNEAAWLVASAVAAARCLVLCVAAGARYPRREGTGRIFVEATRPAEGIVAAVLAAAVLALGGWGAGLVTAAASFLAALVVSLGLRWLCQRRLGGITGDCLGAAIELTEGVVLLAAVLVPAAV
jgi:adenosylcobinamide-GDP ribazoletransferase